MKFSSPISIFLKRLLDNGSKDKSQNKFQDKFNLHYLFAFLLFATLGYLGNYFRLPLFFGVDFLFGSIFVLIAIYFYGSAVGIAVSAIASTYTYFLWGQPYAALLLILEGVWVALGLSYQVKHKRSRNMFLLVLTYWLCLGAPLCFISYSFFLKFGFSSVVLVVLKQVINGLFNALIATLVIYYLPIGKWLQKGQGNQQQTIQLMLFYLLLVFVFIPILIISTLTAHHSLQNINLEIASQLRSSVASLTLDLKFWHQRNSQTLQELVKIAAEEKNPERLQLATTAMGKVTPTFLSIFTTDAEGNILTAFPQISDEEKAILSQTIATSDIFQQVKSTLSIAFGDVHIDNKTSKPHVDVAVPIYKDSRFEGFVIAALDISYIQKSLIEESKAWEIETFLLDRQNKVITTTSPDFLTGQVFDLNQGGETIAFGSDQLQWFPKQKNTAAMIRWRRSYYIQKASIDEIPWSLVIRLSPVPYIDALESLHTKILLIVLAIILPATFVANWLSRSFAKPIAKLMSLTTDLQQNLATENDFSWDTNNLKEIDTLGYNFQIMVIALQEKFQEIELTNQNLELRIQERTVELLKSEERWQLAVQAADDGLWDWNIETGTIFRSERWYTMLGMSSNVDNQQPVEWVDLIHPDDRDRLLQLQEDYLTHKIPHYTIEYQMLCQDGSYKWISTQAKALWNEQGEPIRLVGTNNDITDRKLAIAALEKRENYLAMLVELQGHLLTDNFSNQEYRHILSLLGHVSDFSSIKILSFKQSLSNEDDNNLDVYSTWDAQDINPPDDFVQKQFIQALNDFKWISRLINGHIINESLSTIPDAEKVILTSKHLSAILMLPIVVNGNFWGCLSFHDYFCDRIRDPIEIALLRVSASSLALHLERQQAQMEMLEAMESTQRANRAKSEFLATMSHEIRTPMNAVIGMTSLLLDTKLEPDQQEFAEIIRSSGNNLLTIINDILDFSKIESGKLSLDIHSFNLRDCIEESLDLFTSTAFTKGIELAYCMDADAPEQIVSDITRLRQILVNLFSNAVKFTNQGEVTLRVSVQAVDRQQQNYQLLFVVKDTGIGIPKDRYERLFKPFSQVDSSTTRQYGGTGLGLAIANQLTILLGGKMSVESEVTVGSAFTFTISTVADKPQLVNTDLDRRFMGKRLLILEDNDVCLENLVIFARTLQMEVMATKSSEQAIIWLQRTQQFDLAFVDASIPITSNDQDASDNCDNCGIRKLMRSQSSSLPMVLLSHRFNCELCNPDSITLCLSNPIKRSQLYKSLLKLCNQDTLIGSQSKQNDISSFNENFATSFPLKILLAEDNIVNQKIATLFLSRLGYRVDVVANGLEVLESLSRQKYDVILMDVLMPEMDGLTATKKIITESTQKPWIIALTANAVEGDREICLEAGMQDYVSKPFQVQDLMQALERAYSSLQ